MARILVVDDEKLIRWSMKELFSKEGHIVGEAASADEALRLIGRTTYDLVFADFELADENGLDLLRKIRTHTPRTPVVIISALTTQEIKAKLQDLSIFQIVEKPFTSEQIRAAAQAALSASSFDPAGDSGGE